MEVFTLCYGADVYFMALFMEVFTLVILWHDVEVFTTGHEVDVYLWHGVEMYLMV